MSGAWFGGGGRGSGSGGGTPNAWSRGSNTAPITDPYTAISASTVVSGSTATLYIAAFTSLYSWSSTGIRVNVSSTSGTSVTGYIGLYTLDSSDNGTLVANVTAATTVFHTLGLNNFSWTSAYAITSGTRYAVGYMATGVNPGPAVTCSTLTSTAAGNEDLLYPMIAAQLTAQSSLPPSFTKASLTAPTFVPFGVVF